MSMDAESGLIMEEWIVGTTAPASRPARRLRLRLATLLVLVVASAPALALYAKMLEHIGPGDLDAPAVTLLAIVLTGIAVGAWRRASPGQVIAQIGLACAALLVLVEISFTRLVNYWLAIVVAVTIVVPLLARSQASATQGSGTGSRRVAWASTMLLNVALNLSALAIFCLLNNIMNGNNLIVYSHWSQPDAGNAIVVPATPAPMYSLYGPPPLAGVPPSLEPIPTAGPVMYVGPGPLPVGAPGSGPRQSQPTIQGPTPAGPHPAVDNKESQEEHP
jgi:hypothetical protein